ncbi:MAG: hypothetical protein ACHQRM_08070 [Bacteroidia bacterium]
MLFVIHASLSMISCGPEAKQVKSGKEPIDLISVRRIEMQSPSDLSDSMHHRRIVFNQAEVENFVKLWNESKSAGPTKYLVRHFTRVEFKDGSVRTFRMNGKSGIKEKTDESYVLETGQLEDDLEAWQNVQLEQEESCGIVLKTGWYYILGQKTEYKRKVNEKSEEVNLDPVPIVTAQNIVKTEMYQDREGNWGLSMKLDWEGARVWQKATKANIGGRLAFIVDDTLLYTPKVSSEIPGGITALNAGNISKERLEKLKAKIDIERK